MKRGDVIPNLLGLVAYVDDCVPLERTGADGSKEKALFWNVDGTLLVHPDRIEKFNEVVGFIMRNGGAAAMTDEARAKFGIGVRRKTLADRIWKTVTDPRMRGGR